MTSSNKKHHTIFSLFSLLLSPDKRFLAIILAYSVAISILSLALPISIQSLINSITNTAMISPLVTLSLLLLVLLGFSTLVRGLKVLVSEQFQQQFFARMVTEISLRCNYATHAGFESMNRGELMNKFFEIITVQKSLPYLLSGIFLIALQTLIGVIVSSLYHPLYFIFNLVLIASIYIGLRWHYKQALSYAIKECSEKHRLASWLQELGRAHHLFKSKNSKIYASKKSETLLEGFLKSRKLHFRHFFSQVTFLLVLYTFSNAILLFISGFLVLKGELTLGQLVATEVILSSIFVNLYKAGNYLETFYDISASTTKLNYFFDLELEKTSGTRVKPPFHLEFKDALFSINGSQVKLNYTFAPGKRYLIKTKSSSLKKLFNEIIHGYSAIEGGFAFVNQTPVYELDIHYYRNYIGIVDSDDILEGPLQDYLCLGNHRFDEFRFIKALKTVDVYEQMLAQNISFKTELHPSGYPFSRTNTFKLKMAKCIIDASSLVILNDYITEFIIENDYLQEWIKQLPPKSTVIFLESAVHPDLEFDHILTFDSTGLHEYKMDTNNAK